MEVDHIARLNNRIQSELKKLKLEPEQRIIVQTTISRIMRTYVEEIEDPFKDLEPTFHRLINHEEALENLIEELKEVSTGFGETVKSTTLFKPVTVRRNHRIVIKEFPEGTTLRKQVYRTKRPKPCPNCGGTGKTDTQEECKPCEGKGTTHPVRAVMLEIQ